MDFMETLMLSNAPATQGRPGLLEHLTDNAEMGLYVLSLRAEEPVCEYANPAWGRWSKSTVQELQTQQKPWLSCFHPDDRVRMQQLYLKVFLTGCPEKTEYRIYCPPENVIYATDTVCPVWDESGGETLGVCGCVQDISLIHAAREEMQRTQLLQSLGGLMAGIAHEINTPLQFIGDNLQFISDAWKVLSRQITTWVESLEELGRNPEPVLMHSVLNRLNECRKESNSAFLEQEFPKAVQQSLDGIERLMQLAGAMRDFSHLDERRQAPADLNRAIRSALTLLHNELKYTCDIETQLESNLPEINCSIDEINRVLLNLLINAGHSIAEKIEQGRLKRGQIRVGSRRQEKGLQIWVEDNGMGIPPEIQHRIFERYFTTKRNHPDWRGTGQGLSMAHQAVVDHHHGTLTFESRAGEGTTFYVLLPFQQNSVQEGQ
jgi:signal transduction histidine kinase